MRNNDSQNAAFLIRRISNPAAHKRCDFLSPLSLDPELVL